MRSWYSFPRRHLVVHPVRSRNVREQDRLYVLHQLPKWELLPRCRYESSNLRQWDL